MLLLFSNLKVVLPRVPWDYFSYTCYLITLCKSGGIITQEAQCTYSLHIMFMQSEAVP